MNKKIIAMTLASTLGLVGCGGSDDSGSGDSGNGGSGGGTAPQTATLSGVVNKGIVKNAKVEVCDTFDEMGCDDSKGYYFETMTDESGRYQSDANAPQNTPLLVLVSKQDSTTEMKCDIADCDTENPDTVTFGNWFEVDSDWQLRAVLSEASVDNKTVNVTSLTDVAAVEVFEMTDGTVSKDVIINTTAAVKQAFGITDDLTELGGVDLTDPVAVSEADTDELKVATLSAAFFGVDDEAKKALISVSEEGDGGLTINLTQVADMQAVAKDVVDEVATEFSEEFAESGTTFTDLEQDLDIVPNQDVTPTIPESSDKLAVKEFIKDIRTVADSAEDGGRLSSGLSDFGNDLELIGDVISEDFDTTLEAAVMAIVFSANAAADNIMQEDEDTAYPLTKISDDQGFDISESSIVQNADGSESHTITGYVTESGVTISLTATVSEQYLNGSESGDCDWDNHDGNINCSETIAAGIDFDINSLTATSTNVETNTVTTLSIVDGTAVVTDANAQFDEQEAVTSITNGESMVGDMQGAISVAGVKFEFPNFTLTSTTNSVDQLTLKAGLLLNIEDFAFAADEEWTEEWVDDWETVSDGAGGTYEQYNGYYTGNEDETESFSISRADLKIDGDITLADGEKVAALLDIRIENNGYTHTVNFSEEWGSMNYSSSEESSSETSTKFVKAYAVAQVSTNVASEVDDAVQASITLDAARESLDVVDAKLTVVYDDITTVFETQFGLYDNEIRQDVVVKDGQGVVATFTDVENNAEGVVTVNGAQTATVSDNDGMTIVRYNDGTFESLF